MIKKEFLPFFKKNSYQVATYGSLEKFYLRDEYDNAKRKRKIIFEIQGQGQFCKFPYLHPPRQIEGVEFNCDGHGGKLFSPTCT